MPALHLPGSACHDESMPSAFRKSSPHAPTGYFAWEAAGLRWLADADGARVVELLDVGPDHLDLVRLASVSAAPHAADELGRALARTHSAGAPAYGSGPPDWKGAGFLGPLSEPLPLVLGSWATWGPFLAQARVAPLVRAGRDGGVFSPSDAAVFDRLAEKVANGAHDTGEPPARLHGDLWSGNLMWTSDGAVLIDPAAHGGHREADLAMLALFGCPHLERIVAAYEEVSPLADGWRDRVLLHQLHPLLLHALLFGGSYAAQCRQAADHYA